MAIERDGYSLTVDIAPGRGGKTGSAQLGQKGRGS